MQFLVYGAGAIGGVVGARLFQAGHDVVLVARGEHARVMRSEGLTLATPDETVTLPIPVVADVTAEAIAGPAIALLAVKSQDTVPALADLGRAGGVEAVVCLQNGVANERAALRRFDDVYGVCVMMPADHVEPGVVTVRSAPVTGLLDIGRYPHGMDPRAHDIAAALTQATFLSEARGDIMRWKYRKLVMNLGNAVNALSGPVEPESPAATVIARLEEEAERCFAAAGIDVASVEEDRVRRADHLVFRPVEGRPRGGGSSYQSLLRRTGSIETDYLNGEICLLGRMYGVPTPANAVLQRLANQAAQQGWPPGRMPAADLLAAVAAAGG